MVTRQFQAQERKSIHRSGSGTVRAARVRHHPTTRQVCSEEVDLKSSKEISLWVEINKIHGQAQAWHRWAEGRYC